jgi:hypothetical protein
LPSFRDPGVPACLTDLLATDAITTPTPIQAATLPDASADRDVLGRGRTGSGKTLAFLLPLVARMTGGGKPRPGAPRGLILAPTREGRCVDGALGHAALHQHYRSRSGLPPPVIDPGSRAADVRAAAVPLRSSISGVRRGSSRRCS